MSPDKPLQYPPHYPPTDRWQKFFIGVRWLGPDLSFFKELAAQQRSRSADLLNSWGGGERQRIATQMGTVLARRLGWPTPYFLPGDNLAVVAGGPRFNTIDRDLDVDDAIGELQERLGVTMPTAFWQGAGPLTLAELVDHLLAAGAVPNGSFEPTPTRSVA